MNENAKKYIASSFNAALKRVKSDLGSEAVILSHETINGKTHVIATNNYIPEVQTPVEQTIQADNTSFDAILEIKLPQESNPNTINNLNEFTSTIITTPTNLVENTNKLNDDQNRIIEELDIIKKLLLTNDKQSANTKKHKINKKYSQIKKKLIQHGFSLHLAEHLLSDLPVKYSYEKSYNYVTNKLLNLLNFGAIDFASSAKIKGFVGPSGSGKTRLICKIIMDLMENNLGKNKLEYTPEYLKSRHIMLNLLKILKKPIINHTRVTIF
jgi:flagellar biosynthesis GTPase FlhF